MQYLKWKERERCVLDCTHPLVQMQNSMNICLFNIRSWNLHLNISWQIRFMLATVASFALLRQVLLLKIIHMQMSVNGYPLGRTFTSLLSMVWQYAMTRLE